MMGEEPVATTKRLARISTRPASTVFLSRKFAVRVDHADAQAGEALSGVVGRDGGDDAMNVIVNLAIVDLRLDGIDAEVDRISHCLRALACRE